MISLVHLCLMLSIVSASNIVFVSHKHSPLMDIMAKELLETHSVFFALPSLELYEYATKLQHRSWNATKILDLGMPPRNNVPPSAFTLWDSDNYYQSTEYIFSRLSSRMNEEKIKPDLFVIDYETFSAIDYADSVECPVIILHEHVQPYQRIGSRIPIVHSPYPLEMNFFTRLKNDFFMRFPIFYNNPNSSTKFRKQNAIGHHLTAYYSTHMTICFAMLGFDYPQSLPENIQHLAPLSIFDENHSITDWLRDNQQKATLLIILENCKLQETQYNMLQNLQRLTKDFNLLLITSDQYFRENLVENNSILLLPSTFYSDRYTTTLNSIYSINFSFIKAIIAPSELMYVNIGIQYEKLMFLFATNERQTDVILRATAIDIATQLYSLNSVTPELLTSATISSRLSILSKLSKTRDSLKKVTATVDRVIRVGYAHLLEKQLPWELYYNLDLAIPWAVVGFVGFLILSYIAATISLVFRICRFILFFLLATTRKKKLKQQ